MAIQVIMPQMGESVVEGTVSKWLKARGQPVSEYEPLLEVNTDKVDSEIPSPAAGVLVDILVPEGTTVQAGTVLAVIETNGEGHAGENPLSITGAAGAAPSAERPGTNVASTAPGAAPAQSRVRDLGFISPVVAKIASEHAVDLALIEGTGQGGRITKKDVLAYLETTQAQPAEPVPSAQVEQVQPVVTLPIQDTPAAAPARVDRPTGSDGPAAPLPSRAPATQPYPSVEHREGEILPLTAVRRSIAEHMVLSKHTSPHVTTVMEVDLSRVSAHREKNKAAFERDGARLTFTAYFIAAAVGALKAYPIVNASWTEDGIRLHAHIHIGMATSLGEAGLIVPVIRDAGHLSLLGLASTINDLASRARARQLKPDEVKGGTFTLTNHGTSGSLFATPIINQPQCAILGVGAIQKRVVVVSDGPGKDAIAIRPMAYVSLTFDHRILDGAIADTFLGKVVELLQNWG